MYNGGEFGLSGGTSASTPIFAGVINRLNEERLNHGKGPIGFLNPSLYANPSMLNDITNGTWITCSSSASRLLADAYNKVRILDATQSVSLLFLGMLPTYGACCEILMIDRWDPVTGLGTPNFPKMLEYYLSLP